MATNGDNNLAVDILGHADIDTTASVYLFEEDTEVARRVVAHLDQRRTTTPAEPPTTSYDPAHLAVLLGGREQ
ncbi:hypothetical protein FOS14_11260 [Skermania sp. ID1734]|uniref:hypothetical protein n=1 Tax=Skermania sp. ID1734 TaxID=2597516 RepID=UPI00117DCE60|nr:hypothetical protein [Skermania sp. ID1734]TSD99814.1 hypothetical protein FOS14_11260 [Skermania sp. ID1734]